MSTYKDNSSTSASGGAPPPDAVHEAPVPAPRRTFRERVRRLERRLIVTALAATGGSVSRAARYLGFDHHNSLIALLNSRHKDLLPARTPPTRRRRSVIAGRAQGPKAPRERSPAVLHVEDNPAVADAVRLVLADAGYEVTSCPDGHQARALLSGKTRFDLLILDNDLPGATGLELLAHARSLKHRRRTPAIMLSASDCEPDAWRAGASDFLRKPQDVTRLAQAVERLLRDTRRGASP